MQQPENDPRVDGQASTPADTSPWLSSVSSADLQVDPPGALNSADRQTSWPAAVPAARVETDYSEERASARPFRQTFLDRRVGILHVFIALLFAVLSCASVALTYRGYGHSWDEALYLRPSQEALNWWRGLASGNRDVVTSQSITRAWGERLDSQDPLHPEVGPLPKVVLGAGTHYLGEWLHDPLLGMRFPIAVLFGLTVGLAYLFGMLEFGHLGGCAAALFYWLTPRVFGHAHIGASETLLAFLIALTCFLFVLSTRRGWLAPFVGIVFGLAVAAKVTALLLPLPLLLWGQVYRRKQYASAMFSLVFIAPLVALAAWPWLWYDTLRRAFTYILFYMEHQSTAVFYLGRIWGYTHGPAAPWHYPWVITGVGIPEWLLLFALLGALRAASQVVFRPVSVLVLACALLWIGFTSLPTTPKYDGERLFFPSFFFMALLAAGGFVAVFDLIAWRRRKIAVLVRAPMWPLPWVLLSGIATWGAFDLFVSHPNHLNYFNWLTGRPAGAYKAGFETSYWGEALNEEATSYLRQTLKPGDRVQVLAMNELCFENLRQWDRLPKAADFTANGPPLNWILLQVRQGFHGRYERGLRSSLKPTKVFSAQGVPRLELYAAPAALRVADTATTTVPTAGSVTTAPVSWRVASPSADKLPGTGTTESSATQQISSANQLTSDTLPTSGSLPVGATDLATSSAAPAS